MAHDLSVPLTLSVTGHRDLRADEIPAVETRLHELFDLLARRYPDTPLRLLTPLAEGGDRVAARRISVPTAVPKITRGSESTAPITARC